MFHDELREARIWKMISNSGNIIGALKQLADELQAGSPGCESVNEIMDQFDLAIEASLILSNDWTQIHLDLLRLKHTVRRNSFAS